MVMTFDAVYISNRSYLKCTSGNSQFMKMEGHTSIWEARISAGYRMTFQINGDTYLLRRAGSHDILKKP